jgi:4-amino-4-deoxy-L-arabinose transferase-like glycosyltransferase
MSASLRPGVWLALAAAFTLLWFGALDVRRLQHPDEGRYAEIAREMLVSGDWVTPRLNGLKYFEKPPLQYWLAAATYAAFGTSDWTARLPAALFGWLAVLAIGYAGLRVAGAAEGAYAAAALAGSVWHIGISHFVSLDAVLSGWLALALAAFLIAQSGARSPAQERGWMLAAWAAVAGAVLTKGPVGAVIAGGALVFYSLLARDWAIWRRLALLPGVALMVALCAPWFVLVSARNPEFARFFFIHEHIERFLTTEHQREGAWWYFLPLLVAGLLPWTGLFAWKAWDSWKNARSAANGFSWPRFCLAWALFVLLFFSASGSKLPSYILPMFPALALVIGAQLARVSPRAWRVLLVMLAAGGAVLAVALLAANAPLAARLATERTPPGIYVALLRWVAAGMISIALSGLIAWLAERRDPRQGRTLGVVVLALGMNLGMALAFWANDALGPARSTAELVEQLHAASPPYDARAPFYQVRMYDQTLPWYLRRTTTVVDYRDELALGLDAEPQKGIADTAAWIAHWQSLPQGYALMTPETFDDLAKHVPMRAVARSPRYVVVARR